MKDQKTTPEEREALKEQRSHIKRTIPRHQLQAEWDAAHADYEAAKAQLQEALDRIQRRSNPLENKFCAGDLVVDTVYRREGSILGVVGYMPYEHVVGANYEVRLTDGRKLVLHEVLLQRRDRE